MRRRGEYNIYLSTLGTTGYVDEAGNLMTLLVSFLEVLAPTSE